MSTTMSTTNEPTHETEARYSVAPTVDGWCVLHPDGTRRALFIGEAEAARASRRLNSGIDLAVEYEWADL